MRSNGILLHISSLPSKYGIGTLGEEAYKFVDFLQRSGQSFWQVLPVLTTSYGNSPYQSFSTFAGNPYFIDLDLLQEEDLLTEEDMALIPPESNLQNIDYNQLFQNRFLVLYQAYKRGWDKCKEALDKFAREQKNWLEDYSLFMALKEYFDYKSYHEWPIDIKLRYDNAIHYYKELLADRIDFYKFIQYLFFRQWFALKEYANQNQIQIIGDMPIYVADDSADEWVHKDLFWLDQDSRPVKIAGVPPDQFTMDGQLWGNPIYNWSAHKAQDFWWWQERLKAVLDLYDVVRIDHFRGFASFYAVPYGDTTARNGEWIPGPGMELFGALKNQIEGFRIIAEDLGYMDEQVKTLLKDTGFPGMKVMLFGFENEGKNRDVPHAHVGNYVSYIGTHDNQTFMGWIKDGPRSDVTFAVEYMNLTKEEGYHWGAIRTLMATGVGLTVIQMQDLLGLTDEARMNKPSTLGENWIWRLPSDWWSLDLEKRLTLYTDRYGRLKANKRVVATENNFMKET